MRLAPHRPISLCEVRPSRQILFATSAACALAALGLATPMANAQNSTTSKPAAALRPATTSPATHQSAGGPQEGIKVHGHWVIEVKNPDGTVVRHREFENKLENPGGAQFIAQILGGIAVLGQYAIALPVPCSTQGSSCIVSQTGGAALQGVAITSDVSSAFGGAIEIGCASTPCAMDLQTLSVVANGQGAGTVVLSGSVVATASGKIGGVESYSSVCTVHGITQSECLQQQFSVNPLTGTLISPAVAFSDGQTITVTVTISFQ